MKKFALIIVTIFFIEAIIGFFINNFTIIPIQHLVLYLLLVIAPMALVLVANLFSAVKGSVAGVIGSILAVLYLLLSVLQLPWQVFNITGDLAVLFAIAAVFRMLSARLFPKLKPYYGWWLGFILAFVPSLIIEMNLISIGKGYISLLQVLGFIIAFSLSGGYT